ncbi:16S rRNA (cytosine(1402)-N(4))-methyltransferase RsmH [Patescibacteria group bacterium]|nr:16S rRNA (cytosine(1402)-N(4))-methyltransferase RsmH [Patescibacteria group bacterium]MBU1612921.1 16S rRNA (cytosine(1402)-N(4))-methyltransferase RsmH [Patescibacteria group bacterium]
MQRHIPVLVGEVIDGLNLKPGTNAVDCTLGDGGHAEAILEKTAPNGKLVGVDADVESILRAKRNLYRYEDRVIFVRDNFQNIKKIIAESKVAPIHAILIDLGWSTPQFAERGRGFSFEKDEPLDMRYESGREEHETASDILNNYNQEELEKILKNFAEEKFHKEIAESIVEERKSKKIETTKELAEIVLKVYRRKLNSDKEIPWIGGIHPATQTFQALRIAVNKELEVLKKVLPDAIEALTPGGRLAVISFHSLEDRIVKQYFKKIENKEITLLNKKPIIAGEEELRENPRARSAKLRIVEKINQV